MELTRTRDILATLWPALSADDSEFQRRKKIAVRSAQSAVIVMVAAALGGAIATDFPRLPAWQVGSLVLAGLAYIVWSIHGTHDVVRLLLWEGREAPPEQLLRSSHRGALGYFTVQLGLAALLYYLGDQGHATPLDNRTLLSVYKDIEVVGEAANGEEALHWAKVLQPSIAAKVVAEFSRLSPLRSVPNPALIEPLSDREREVLQQTVN
jgi:hypothetical protein